MSGRRWTPDERPLRAHTTHNLPIFLAWRCSGAGIYSNRTLDTTFAPRTLIPPWYDGATALDQHHTRCSNRVVISLPGSFHDDQIDGLAHYRLAAAHYHPGTFKTESIPAFRSSVPPTRRSIYTTQLPNIPQIDIQSLYFNNNNNTCVHKICTCFSEITNSQRVAAMGNFRIWAMLPDFLFELVVTRNIVNGGPALLSAGPVAFWSICLTVAGKRRAK